MLHMWKHREWSLQRGVGLVTNYKSQKNKNRWDHPHGSCLPLLFVNIEFDRITYGQGLKNDHYKVTQKLNYK